MTARLPEVWAHLAATPLLGLTSTVLAYLLAVKLHEKTGRAAWANPVAVAVALVAVFLAATGTPYRVYIEGAQFIQLLLGPATVALAVPLYEQRQRLRRLALPLALGLAAGVATAIVSAVGLAWALGASRATLLSLAPKSATAPVAMGIAERIGGVPALSVVLAVATGIAGALLAPPLLRWLRIDCHATAGFAMGLAAHGIGTARAFQVDAERGAFAGLAMGLAALSTALVAPWLAPPLVGLLAG